MAAQEVSPVPQLDQVVLKNFQKIQHFVVLMLENRSFDHLLGYLKIHDPRIAGITGHEYSNDPDPHSPTPSPITIGRATSYALPFDPGHEFLDIQMQLYGPEKNLPTSPNTPTSPAPLSGFVASARHTAETPEDAARVMECFQSDQVPVLTALAQEFALCNYRHASLPGPTWPNRFFAHAATSGGLKDSPTNEQMALGFSFTNGTIYDSLANAKKDWRIYHDGLPQTAWIDSLRPQYIDPFTHHFREMRHFEVDVQANSLPEYTFIEPNYDTGHNYTNGNSMHPLNDIRKGEQLIKQVYETLRKSAYWEKVMLIVSFDEHGGFYDHVPPCATMPTGDDHHYADPNHPFGFDLLGIRVPAIVISVYTQKGTIVGDATVPNQDVFDHTSILATVEKRFGLSPLTERDKVARTFDIVLNQAKLRLSPVDVPLTLPNPAPITLHEQAMNLLREAPAAVAVNAPLSKNQRSMLALALACDLDVSPSSQHQAIRHRHQTIIRQDDAAAYIQEVERKIHSKRP